MALSPEGARERRNTLARWRYENDPNVHEKQREASRKWREANREKSAEYTRKWREANPEKALASKNRWNKANPERLRAAANKRRRKRYAENGGNSLAAKLRIRLRIAMKRGYKSGSAVRDLGCTIEEFRQHLENHFQDGMTWENHGSYWHIDHTRPLCSFDLEDREQLLQAVHWSNQMPMTAEENIKKGGRWQHSSTSA